MPKQWHIYALLNASGDVFYVGKSHDTARRLKEHRTVLGFRPAMQICETGNSNWRDAEHRWIEHFRKAGAPLINKTVGGNGAESLSAEARQHLSDIHRGKVVSAETREKRSRSTKGVPRPLSEHVRESHRQKSGVASRKFWNSLSADERAAFLARKNVAIKAASQTPEFKQKVSTNSKQWWGALSPEERIAFGNRVTAGKMKRPVEARQADARRAAQAALEKPGAKERLGGQVRNWWASLSPEKKAEFIAQRALKIAAAKAAKKAA